MSIEPPEHFHLEERDDDGRTVLALRGELDLATVEPVRVRLDALCAARTPVLLDLDGLEFMDSTGIRLVLRAVQERDRAGWDFTVTRGSPTVRRLFRSARIEDRLPYPEVSA
jgi:anti-sigma B factor antagonist